jgi:hypothetical protein
VTTERTLVLANPLLDHEVRLLVPQEWSDETLSRILSEPRPTTASRSPFAQRARLLALVLLVLAVLALPTYAIGRAVKGWLAGEPAPPSIVHNFGSYAPRLGFKPEPGKAVRVASDGAFILYATPNDRGSYCVATSTPDGGICILPSIAATPLIAGIMPDGPGRADARRAILVAGRVTDPDAVGIAFTDPDGATVTRRIGAGGFFLAALPTAERPLGGPPYPCKNGDWTPTFRAVGSTGEELLTAQITLASTPVGAPPGVVCGWANGPHS